ATEKARLAEQERARLAAEGAQKAQQARADADAKAAEQARIAAEKAKQVAQDQATAAEQKRAAAEAKGTAQGTEKVVETKAVAANADAGRGPSTAERPQGEKQAEKQGEKGPNLAALTAGAPQVDITKAVQAELRRVGCLTASTEGQWNAASQRSMALFNRHAGTKLDVKLASLDALDTIKLKSSRVCPLVCEHGFKADGNGCSKITCASGSFLNDDNECEKRRARQPVARRDRPEPRLAPEASQVPRAAQAIAGRPPTHMGAGTGSQGRPLTGIERERGCYTNSAIMSGVCP
ncbi:MAG: hypothetical protein JWR80_2551, partial [Bradyrhizobium sp.]|nr:hypothetical protein [Bradyrhizobium sp.]